VPILAQEQKHDFGVVGNGDGRYPRRLPYLWREASKEMNDKEQLNEGLASVNVEEEIDVSRIRKLAGLANNNASATGQRVVGEAGELDHEVEMARQQVYSSAQNAIRIYELLTHINEQQGLEGWVQSYLTKAADYLSAVADSLEHDSAPQDETDQPS
jgi:hypothetical protein